MVYVRCETRQLSLHHEYNQGKKTTGEIEYWGTRVQCTCLTNESFPCKLEHIGIHSDMVALRTRGSVIKEKC